MRENRVPVLAGPRLEGPSAGARGTRARAAGGPAGGGAGELGLPRLPRREGLHRGAQGPDGVALRLREGLRRLDPRRPRSASTATPTSRARSCRTTTPLKKVDCGACHEAEAKQHAASLHGKAMKRGDSLAPTCASCHGMHDIRAVKDPLSPVSPLKMPFTCGKCHQEGTAVMRQRNIHQDHILENYSESIHGEGLLKKGLIVAANCASCHTAHNILPHTDPASSIARGNIAAHLHDLPRPASRTCTARSSRASCGRRRPTSCPRASTATSRTRCARSSTRRAWRTPTA